MKTYKGFICLILLLAYPVLLFSGSQVDPSLTPWIGVWTITEDSSAGRASNLSSKATVQIQPTTDGKGLEISREMAQQPAVKEILIPDGTKRPINAQNCSGWQTAKLVPESGVIIASSEMNCKESGSFATSGLRMLLAADQMVDILGIKAAGQTRLAIRRLMYEQDLPGVSQPGLTAAAARTAASAPWSVNAIIQLSGMIDTPILQAALMEKNARLSLTPKSLKQLAAAKVPKEIIDLLVAIAYPDRFDIQTNGQVALRPWSGSSTGGSAGIYYPPGINYYPGAFYNCYDPYGSSFGFGYTGLLSPGSCWSYYSPFWWDYPVYFIGVSSGTGYNARLSATSGYIHIEPRGDTGRHARPRQGFVSSGGYQSPPGYSTTTSGSSSSGSSSGGSSTSSSGGSSSGSGGSPSASPGGYSSGGSSGGHAVPR